VQYFLGDSLLVAPVVMPANPNTSLSTVSLWLPPGTWFDILSGALRTVGAGGETLVRDFDLSEVPLFVPAGTVLPLRPLSSVPS
jgi:alpha-glucosidase (family GH31 glycosyl hydrolase)